MKKVFILIMTLVSVFSFADNLFINFEYGSTLDASIQTTNNTYKTYSLASGRYDYVGGRLSWLFKTEDTDQLYFGPYVGFFYNVPNSTAGSAKVVALKDYINDYSLSLGLNIRYINKIFPFMDFTILAYGGVHTPDWKSYSTEILLSCGFRFANMFYVNGGYNTKYLKLYNTDTTGATYAVLNYLPVSVGVGVDF